MVLDTTLDFARLFSTSNLFLVETDEAILAELQSGKCFIKGAPQEQAVFVTSSQSFNMRRQDNSNLQYICHKGEILGESNSVIKLERLFSPLISREIPESGDAQSQLSNIHFKSQASSTEVEEALAKDSGLLLADGRYCRIDTRTRLDLLDQILSVFNTLERGTQTAGFSLPETVIILSDNLQNDRITVDVVRALVAPFCLKPPGNYAELSAEGVMRIRFQQVLEQDVSLELHVFLREWQRLVSVSPVTSDDVIDEAKLLDFGRGLMVIDDSLSGRLVKKCDVNELPSTARERLKALFLVKKRWSMDELQIYMRPLFSANDNIGAFLLKNARVQTKTSEGEKCEIYSSLF